MAIPSLGMNPNKTCYNWFIQCILYYSVLVRVGFEYLDKQNKDISVR